MCDSWFDSTEVMFITQRMLVLLGKLRLKDLYKCHIVITK